MIEQNSPGLIEYLSRTDDVVIATELAAGGEVPTEIGAVVVDGVGYIRNGFGEASKWYRRIQRTHRAAFLDGGRRFPVTIEDVDDEPTITAVDEAYKKKYRGPGLRAVISGGTRRYTMRIVPDSGNPP
ncbi:DUF2255 family protein [Humibacter sp. BT305]|nr:DUF2255 family protein [Humibacter sp. BT305]